MGRGEGSGRGRGVRPVSRGVRAREGESCLPACPTLPGREGGALVGVALGGIRPSLAVSGERELGAAAPCVLAAVRTGTGGITDCQL